MSYEQAKLRAAEPNPVFFCGVASHISRSAMVGKMSRVAGVKHPGREKPKPSIKNACHCS